MKFLCFFVHIRFLYWQWKPFNMFKQFQIFDKKENFIIFFSDSDTKVYRVPLCIGYIHFCKVNLNCIDILKVFPFYWNIERISAANISIKISIFSSVFKEKYLMKFRIIFKVNWFQHGEYRAWGGGFGLIWSPLGI